MLQISLPLLQALCDLPVLTGPCLQGWADVELRATGFLAAQIVARKSYSWRKRVYFEEYPFLRLTDEVIEDLVVDSAWKADAAAQRRFPASAWNEPAVNSELP